MIRRPPRSTPKPSSAASDVYKRQMLFQCSSTLSRDGIFTQRHFKNVQISNLLKSRTRLQESREPTHLPATLPTRTLNPCLSLTPSLCPLESSPNLEGKTDFPIPADSSETNFVNSNPSPPPSAPHIHLESQSNSNAILPDNPPLWLLSLQTTVTSPLQPPPRPLVLSPHSTQFAI